MNLVKRYQGSELIKRKTISISPLLAEVVERDDIAIRHFLSQTDIPGWYRGTSQFQLEAADRLLNAIRDDTEQRTAHRVHAVLMQIGLRPLISKSDIKLLMRLSRGNDLAFLWFLMEMRYKTRGSYYTVNEQLIMSAMAHLDMITTLRELDRILPPPLMSKANVLKRRREEEEETNRNKQRSPVKKKPEYILPYFDKVPRPRRYGKPLFIPVPDFRVSFGYYDQYKDPNYVVVNESSRWYATYKIHPGKRIAHHILREELNKIFDDYEAVTTKAEKSGAYCEHHKAIKDLEESLRDKLIVIARERCHEYLHKGNKLREEQAERVRKQLDMDICRCMVQFKAMATKTEKQMLVLTIANECDLEYKEPECDGVCVLGPAEAHELKGLPKPELDSRVLLLGNPNPVATKPDGPPVWTAPPPEEPPVEVHKKDTTVLWNIKDKKPLEASEEGQGEGEISEIAIPVCPDDVSSWGSRMGQLNQPNHPNIQNHPNQPNNPNVPNHPNNPNQPYANIPERRTSKARVSIIENIVNAAGTGCDHIPQSEGEVSLTPSETYFSAPKEHNPYLFDYEKIFTIQPKQRKDDRNTPKLKSNKSMVEALDSDYNIAKDKLNDSKVNVSKAVSDCAMKTWKHGVEAKNIELELEEERKRNLPEEDEPKLRFNKEYYDPEDQDLMLLMLKNALEVMSKDHKFVLASFPEAYKLPLLREWIKTRYGKVYTRAERYKHFNMSMKIFNALDKVTLQVRVPKITELGANTVINYDCRDYLMKKSKYLRDQYYKRLDIAIMEQSRVFWFAMNPNLCTSGPPRNTYYAYMPSRAMDILRFRIWKPSEYMRAREAWDSRMHKKEKEGFK